MLEVEQAVVADQKALVCSVKEVERLTSHLRRFPDPTRICTENLNNRLRQPTLSDGHLRARAPSISKTKFQISS